MNTLSSLNKMIAHKWIEAFNAQHLENLLALYRIDAKHYSPKLKINQPKTNGLIHGKQAMQHWWQDAFTRLPSLTYELVKLTADEHQVFIEYIRHVDGEDNMRVGEVLEVDNGLIVFSRVYHG